MPEISVGLEFLFARLLHPEGMVKERACRAIADLLNSEASQTVRDRLFLWTEAQHLESVVILAPLIWIRSTFSNSSIELPDPEYVSKSFPRPSPLSWLLMKELYGSDFPPPGWASTFSKGLRRDFEPDPVFLRYAAYFLSHSYVDEAEKITKTTRSPFINQWAWEWSRLTKELSVIPDLNMLEARGQPDSFYYMCYDFKLSEIYRSAYLRALSWAVFNGLMSQGEAEMHATKCCPIDVGLWRLTSGRTPEWWPGIEKSDNTIDDGVGLVIEQLKNLFHQQTHEADNWSLTQANGLVDGKNVHVELEIYGVFQRCVGPTVPDLREVLDGFRWKVMEPLIFDSWIKLSGCIFPYPDFSHGQKIGDWEIIPAFSRIETPVFGHWQWWRYYRQVWAPALCLVDGGLNITVTEKEICYDHKSTRIGRWTDWLWGLRDRRDANLPPATGQALFVRREVLDRFSDSSKCSFCWFWRATAYHRRGDWEKYETVSFDGELGSTRICLK
jgi:hypothetical protein